MQVQENLFIYLTYNGELPTIENEIVLSGNTTGEIIFDLSNYGYTSESDITMDYIDFVETLGEE